MSETNEKITILAFCGTSGSGRGTFIKMLLEKYPEKFALCIADTTREKRPYEIEGINHNYISIKEFRERIARGEYIEYEEVYPGAYYGTPKQEINRIANEGKVAILDLDIFGAIAIKKIFSTDVFTIFIDVGSAKTCTGIFLIGELGPMKK